MSRAQRRASGTIDKLPVPLKDTVDQMLLSGESYKSIVNYLAQNEVELSQQSVCRYARRFLASAQELRIASENFKMIMSETEKYPNLDPAEAILRITSQKLFDAVAQIQDDKLDNMSAEKIISQCTALARAVAYKRNVDSKVKSSEEAALDSNQTLLYDAIRSKNPRLYAELLKEIEKLRKEYKERK